MARKNSRFLPRIEVLLTQGISPLKQNMRVGMQLQHSQKVFETAEATISCHEYTASLIHLLCEEA